MGITTLSTVAAVVLERAIIDKRYVFSAAKFTAVADYVLLRIGEGEADVLLSGSGTSIIELNIPAGLVVYAWASAGTPLLATHTL